ncbi:unnamed protein product, partial [Adineta steineri]
MDSKPTCITFFLMLSTVFMIISTNSGNALPTSLRSIFTANKS